MAAGLAFRAILTVQLLATAFAALPSYISTCNRNDPKLNECIVRNGQKAIPKFINGDPKTRVPNLNPMLVQEMRVAQGSRQIGMNITVRNMELYGLKDVKFVKSRTQLDKKYGEWDFELPKLEIIGKYNVNGRVLLLPISGDGRANITIVGVKFTYKHGWDYFKKKGKDHLKINKDDLPFTASRAYFDLENLFNGDRLLGENMNRFLNENWPEVLKDIGPGLSKAFANLISSIINRVGDLVPFSEVYP